METNLENAITIAIVGFIVVFIALIFFATVIAGVNKLDMIVTERKKQKQAKPVSQKSGTVSQIDDDDVVPVIAAAVNATVDENVVIRKIIFAHDATANNSWSHISRAKNIDSHNIQTSRKIYGK
jgi:sodium pump decarboxylase gamma subunit